MAEGAIASSFAAHAEKFGQNILIHILLYSFVMVLPEFRIPDYISFRELCYPISRRKLYFGFKAGLSNQSAALGGEVAPSSKSITAFFYWSATETAAFITWV